MFEIIATDENGQPIAHYTEKDSFTAQDIRDRVRASFPVGSSNQVIIRKQES